MNLKQKKTEINENELKSKQIPNQSSIKINELLKAEKLNINQQNNRSDLKHTKIKKEHQFNFNLKNDQICESIIKDKKAVFSNKFVFSNGQKTREIENQIGENQPEILFSQTLESKKDKTQFFENQNSKHSPLISIYSETSPCRENKKIEKKSQETNKV